MVVTGLDVVSRLGDHQANLVPPDVAPRQAIVALPTPPILHALLGEHVAALRRSWIASWAARIGGGDGAVPAIDLDADARSLRELVHDIDAVGTRTLLIIGGRDQPGFARELALRWPHALATAGAGSDDLQADLAAPLHDDPAPSLILLPGIARLLAGAPVPRDASLVLLGVDGDDDPGETIQLLVREGMEVRVYARDRARVAGRGHGFVPPAALFGTEQGNRLRERWREVWCRCGGAEAFREAVLGLDPVLEQRLAEPAQERPTRHHARLFSITGLDGSGKSTQAALLARTLTERGLTACVLKLYRQGAFLSLADELGARTRRGAPLAAFRVSRIVKLVDSLRVLRDVVRPALDSHDAIIFDRYTETHIAAAASQLGWNLSRHPVLAVFPPCQQAFWLELAPKEALRRLLARGERLTADEHATGLTGYARAFDVLAHRGCDHRLDSTAAMAVNAARIAGEALACFAGPRGRRSPACEPRRAPAAPSIRQAALDVVIGEREHESPELGADIAALAQLLCDELGGAAAGIPASFWLESYCAQLVIDARTCAAARASVLFWPSALRRVPLFRDLLVLDEIARMLAPLVSVGGWEPVSADAPMLRLLAPASHARARLAAEYNVALAREAAEQLWPARSPARRAQETSIMTYPAGRT